MQTHRLFDLDLVDLDSPHSVLELLIVDKLITIQYFLSLLGQSARREEGVTD